MSDELPAAGNQSWRRQAALFAAIASAITGAGVAIILLMTGRSADPAQSRATPTPPPIQANASPTP